MPIRSSVLLSPKYMFPVGNMGSIKIFTADPVSIIAMRTPLPSYFKVSAADISLLPALWRDQLNQNKVNEYTKLFSDV